MSLSDLQHAKEQIRQAVDIVELVGGYIALRRQGRGFVGLCPWHDDSRPSFQVNPERQSFKCWVCDVGGDVFSFLMKAERIEFREALEMLAERAGVSLAPAGGSPRPIDSQFERKNLLRACDWAARTFHECLLRSEAAAPARGYVAQRGLDPASVEQFQLGFAPPEWDWLLRRAAQASVSPAVLERVDLAAARDGGGHYDRFRGRLMFPIRDARGRTIAFGGRVLPELARPDDAKYVNSRETPLFNKSSHLYALDLARNAGEAEGLTVMEGYTDVIMAHQHGVTSAVAVLGTALGERHVPLIRRYADRVTLVLDGDAAGQRRTDDIIDNLLALFVAQEIEFRILTLPEGADPCDVIRSHGSEHFRRLLAQSADALEHKIKVVTNGLGTTAGPHRTAQALEAILGTLARAVPAGAASSTALLREQQVLARLARQFDAAEETLRMRLRQLRGAASRPAARLRSDETHAEPVSAAVVAGATPWERELIELLLYAPDCIEAALEHVDATEDATPDFARTLGLISQLHHEGQAATFDALMTAADDERVKNLLVDCDESGQRKRDSDPQLRLRDLLASAERRRQDARHGATVAELRTNQLDPQQADRALVGLFADLKRRQSGAPLTDE